MRYLILLSLLFSGCAHSRAEVTAFYRAKPADLGQGEVVAQASWSAYR